MKLLAYLRFATYEVIARLATMKQDGNDVQKSCKAAFAYSKVISKLT